MASAMKYRSGVIQYVPLGTDPSHACEEGDLVGWKTATNTNGVSMLCAEPATTFSTALDFKNHFAGVVMHKTGLQSYVDGAGNTHTEFSFNLPLVTDPGYTLVATTGVFEYDNLGMDYRIWTPGDIVAVGCYSTYASYPAWATSTFYPQGTRVYSSTTVYVCNATHTSAATGVLTSAGETTYWTSTAGWTAAASNTGACTNQQVWVASDITTAIGVAVVPYNALGVSSPSVYVKIRSQLMEAGIASGQ
jgi:hypothetical protein